MARDVRLERLALEVPDLERWVRDFEQLLGPGFQRYRVRQAGGELSLAIHPGGVELLELPSASGPRLRSFHLRTSDLPEAVRRARSLGWRPVDRVVLDGRAHEFFDAHGLRVVLVEDRQCSAGDVGPGSAQGGAGR